METKPEIKNEEVGLASEYELPPEPPLRGIKRRRFVGMGMEGGIWQIIIVALAVSLVVFVGMGMFGGGNLVSKADFTRNMSGVGAVLEQMKADFDSATQSIPTQVGQANTQMNSVISSLKERIGELESQVADYEARIKVLEEKILRLR